MLNKLLTWVTYMGVSPPHLDGPSSRFSKLAFPDIGGGFAAITNTVTDHDLYVDDSGPIVVFPAVAVFKLAC
jgi:hypothetical protein